MALAGHVRVNNNSGEDYENAQVRLVVGVVRALSLARARVAHGDRRRRGGGRRDSRRNGSS